MLSLTSIAMQWPRERALPPGGTRASRQACAAYANTWRSRVSPRASMLVQPYDTAAITKARCRSGREGCCLPAKAVSVETEMPSAGKAEPSETALSIWKNAQAVCFDVDCTITQQDSLDLLAEYMGVGDEVARLTNQAMDGSMNLEDALEKRLEILNCRPDDLRGFVKKHPPQSRLVPGIRELITALQSRNVPVYLISGGFREMTLPIAKALGVPAGNVFANRMNWQMDDETGLPEKLVGFDPREPTAHNMGKPVAIQQLREKHPYENVVMIGDGITDLEAAQVEGGADLFIGYGGVIERELVRQEADWYVYDHKSLIQYLKRYTVAMIGSGAWACAAANIIGRNVLQDDPADEFVDDVKMWVYQEEFEGRQLTDIINETHENRKYFPGVSIGANVVANPDLDDVVADADLLVFCVPHQFVRSICKQMKGKIKPDARAISLIKGMRVRPDGPQLIHQMVEGMLGINCSVLMGANLAGGIANEELSEATIGYTILENAMLFKKLFNRTYFNVDITPDVVGAEMCGTLKNVVALGCGMVDGMGYGHNSKATIMRVGLKEMKDLCRRLYPTVREDTFFESCGVADLIATCYGGRNHKVATEWTKRRLAGTPATFDELEVEVLKGQKLQGVLTSNEVQTVLEQRGWVLDFPLFTTVNRIVNGLLDPIDVLTYDESAKKDVLSGTAGVGFTLNL